MTQQNIQQMVAQTAAQFPAEVAIASAQKSVTYRELDEGANKLANFLLAHGAQKGELVAILVEDVSAAIAAVLGILKAGCAFVPLDPHLPDKRLELMLAEVAPQWFVIESKFAAQLAQLTAQVALRAQVFALDIDDFELDAAGHLTPLPGYQRFANVQPPGIAADPDDLCYVYFTSGSTGQPKGIAGRLKGIDHFIRWEIETLKLGPQTRVSQLLSLTFDGSLRDIFVPLCAGGVVCVPAGRETLLDASKLIAWLDAERINVVHCVPSLFRALLNEGLRPELFQALRYVLLAGEPLLPADVQKWLAIFGDRIQLINLYGTSETTMAKFIHFVTAADQHRPSIPIGQPMPGARALVVDERGRVCPPGVIGEIYIRTPYRAHGYYNQPRLTKQVFIQNPFSQDRQDVVYKTGDLGRVLPDGNFEFIGRKDQQVKVRGMRVELNEIENLLRQHAAVSDVAVVDYEDLSNNKCLCAYVVLNDNVELGELRDLLAEYLPDYMLPSVFLLMEQLPRTISGKIDRRALPPPMQAERAGEYQAPRTPVEEVLEGVWTRVLGIRRVSVTDNFFHLGGHSLMATQIVSRIRNIFQIELPLQSLFDTPTIAGLADKIEQAMKAGTVAPAPPIAPVPRDRDLPLSFAQQRLWFINQLEPSSPAYNINTALQLRGSLNVAVLAQTLAEIQRRHESLRTTFQVVAGQPAQFIAPTQTVPLAYVDLSAWPQDAREPAAQRLLQQAAMQPFTLARGPVWRTIVVRVGADAHLVLLTMHHAISDGWSMGVLVQEVATLYRAFAAGQPSPLPELPIQYADYAAWQRRWYQAEALEAQLAYWKQQLQGSQQSLELPTDRPRPALQSFHGAYQYLLLPPTLTDALKELSRREGVTLFMTLVAAFKALLYRYTGQEDISIGTPIANRSQPAVESLIGFFVNTLVLRTRVAGRLRFRELLNQVREVSLGAYAHQELPFEKLVEELQPDRDLSRTPLFQVMLVLQNAPRRVLELPALELSALKVESETTKFDLTLELEETEQGLAGKLEYNTDLFDRTTVARLLRHWQNLLEGIVADPEQQLADLPLLGAEEAQQVTSTWNETQTSYPTAACCHELFQAQVARAPDRVALTFADAQLTYQALNRAANQLAHHLRARGVGPESRIGICLERSVELVVSVLAILKAGGAYVPLDPMYAKERLAFMMEDADLAVLLTQEKLRAALPPHKAQVICVEQASELLRRAPTTNPQSGVRPQNLAYVIYTSGSTGKPKGVQIEHGGLCNLADAQVRAFGLRPDNRVLQFASLSFDASIFEIVMALHNGATLCLLDQTALLPGSAMTELLREQAVTNITFPPSALAALADDELPALQTIIVAGEACPAELVARWAGKRRFFNAYGPTETTVWASVDECFADTGKPTIGRPISNVQTYILAAQQASLPIGVPGELHVGGAGLARGYLNRPDLTAEKFVPHPFGAEAGARLYKTGDLARWLPDGRLDFLGRIDYQVKVRGFRIEPGEIETVLAAHPLVSDTVVGVNEDGFGHTNLVAYVVATPGAPPTVGQLRTYLREQLAEFMLPSAFVLLDALPRTPNGKVDRRALPKPDEFRPALEAQYVAPQTEAEQTIAGIWQGLLRLDKVGIHDNFFDLGGHSLLMVQAHSKLQAVFAHELSLLDLFKYPTISALAEFLTQTPSAPLYFAPLDERSDRLAAGKDRLQYQLKLSRQAAAAERLGGQNESL